MHEETRTMLMYEINVADSTEFDEPAACFVELVVTVQQYYTGIGLFKRAHSIA